MTLRDFDNRDHRIDSATGAFQKGFYHLFLLSKRNDADTYARVVRIYQCVFQMCVTQLLLDDRFSLNRVAKNLPNPLKRLCRDPKSPTRRELDPASLVTHSVFENKRWGGFSAGHPLHLASQDALALYTRVVDARHNLLYRPQLLDGLFWEDCTLLTLAGAVPTPSELESLYRLLINSVKEARSTTYGAHFAVRFLDTLFAGYKDTAGTRPTESLLLSYARLLSGADPSLLQELGAYRDELLRTQLTLPSDPPQPSTGAA